MESTTRFVTGFPFVKDWTSLEFQQELPFYRICSLCDAVPNELHMTKCSHFFCPTCFETLKNSADKTTGEIMCPLESAKTPLAQIYKDTSSADILKDFRVSCPNKSSGCCHQDTLASIAGHLAICGYAQIECAACGDKIQRSSMEYHLEKECTRATKTIVNHEAASGEGHQRISPVIRCTNCIQTPKEDILLAEQNAIQISELKEKFEVVQRHIQTLNENESQFSIMSASLASLHDVVHTELKKMREDSVNANKRINSKIEKLQSYLRGRIDLIEDRFKTSRFVWNVKNYSELKQQTLQGVTKSFFSEDFFAGIQGYKMYLGGNMMHKDDNGKPALSLYVYLTKGPYDATLQWPYRRRSSFYLIDQKTSKAHLIADLLPEDLGPSMLHCFRQPKAGQVNEGIGYTAVISLEDLENSEHHYLRNDELFIQFVTSEV